MSGLGDSADVGASGALGARAHRTVERLLDAASEVFAREGFDAARVDDIVSAAGVSHGAFYRYFDNKEEVFQRLAASVTQELHDVGASLTPVAPGRRGRDALRNWIATLADVYARHWPVVQTWTEAESSRSDLGRLGTTVVTDLAAVVARCCRDVVPAGLDAEVGALAVVAMIERASYFEHSRDLAVDHTALVDAMAHVAHDALVATPTRRVEAEPARPRRAPVTTTATTVRASRRRAPQHPTERALLDAAMRCFRARGYRAVRVDDVVKEAGTARGTFYIYFPDKEALLRTLAAECSRRTTRLVDDLRSLEQTTTEPARLDEWLRRFVETYGEYAPVIRAWLEAHTDDPLLLALGDDLFADVTARFADLLVARRSPHADDPAAAAIAFIAMIERFAYFVTSRNLPRAGDEVLDGLTIVVLRGFLGAR